MNFHIQGVKRVIVNDVTYMRKNLKPNKAPPILHGFHTQKEFSIFINLIQSYKQLIFDQMFTDRKPIEPIQKVPKMAESVSSSFALSNDI